MIADPILRDCLRGHLSRHFAHPVEIVSLLRSPLARHSSFLLEELQVTLGNGCSIEVVFKSQGRSGLLEGALGSRLDPPYDPQCEALTYLTLLDPKWGTPLCYGVEIDPKKGRYWMFLEKVAGLELSDVGSLQVWKQVACWLARFHGHSSNSAGAWSGMVRYDAAFYSLLVNRVHRVVRERNIQFTESFSELISCYQEIVDRLVSLPDVVIHGEFYAPNIIVQATGEDVRRICPVDWGTTALAPGLVDLAALVSGAWGKGEQQEIVNAYISDEAFAQREDKDLWVSLGCCRIHLLMQWIYQSRGDSRFSEQVPRWVKGAGELYRELKTGLRERK